jgi:hypothetical protein
MPTWKRYRSPRTGGEIDWIWVCISLGTGCVRLCIKAMCKSSVPILEQGWFKSLARVAHVRSQCRVPSVKTAQNAKEISEASRFQ